MVEAIVGWRHPAKGAAKSKGKKKDDDDLLGVSQDEQGAVAALLAAAGMGEDVAAEPEAEYCVKWVGRAYCHCEWLPESNVAALARRKLAAFKRKHGEAPCNLMRPEWQVGSSTPRSGNHPLDRVRVPAW